MVHHGTVKASTCHHDLLCWAALSTLPLLHAQDPVLAADVDSSTQTQGAVLPSSSVMPNFRQIYWGMPRVQAGKGPSRAGIPAGSTGDPLEAF